LDGAEERVGVDLAEDAVVNVGRGGGAVAFLFVANVVFDPAKGLSRPRL
jgi:hypothetical protein